MNQMSLYDGVKLDPKLMVESACSWIKEGYGRSDGHWMRLVNLIERAYNSGEACVRRGDLYRLAQEQGLSISVCREFRFDNNLWSSLSRYLLMFRPKFAKIIHPKSAEIDTIDFVHMWHEHVSSQTFFLASSWREAVKACECGDVSAS